MDFALSFLNHSLTSRGEESCKIFDDNGWCNCHAFFDVRIGVSEGKVIVFKDVNDNYNAAGNTMNIASRIMGLGDRNHILFTAVAYRNIIDMTEDTNLEQRFVKHGNISVKHDLSIDVCQYIGHGENDLNKEIPIQIQIIQKQERVIKSNPFFAGDMKKSSKSPAEMLKALESMEIFAELPIRDAILSMFSSDGSIPDKERTRAIVEAMMSAYNLIKKGGTQENIIEGRKES